MILGEEEEAPERPMIPSLFFFRDVNCRIWSMLSSLDLLSLMRSEEYSGRGGVVLLSLSSITSDSTAADETSASCRGD